MPKVSVYLPEDLASEVRRRGLSLSKITQRAVQDAIDHEDRSAWVARMRAAPPAVEGDVDVSALFAAVRDDFGA